MKKMPFDIFIITYTFLITGIGLLCLYSASSAHISFSYFNKQLMWLGMGCLVMVLIHVIPVRIIFQSAYVIYGISILLLILVLFLFIGSYPA